ncbi:hypothetical protein K1719_031897 [Acacia pycnantha]|nr:hypothetical protein K1719_031897 [Acacia pycnantha]
MPATTFPDWFEYSCEGDTLRFWARGNLPPFVFAFDSSRWLDSFRVCISINGHKIEGEYLVLPFDAPQGHHVLFCERSVYFTKEQQKDISRFMDLDYWNEVEIQVTSDSPDASVVKCGVYVYKKEINIMENVQFKCCDDSTTSRNEEQ